MRWPKIHCGCNADWKPSHNVAPTALVPIIIQTRDGTLELQSARWGLVPPWWTKAKPPALTFNARAEDAADKPTWRDSLRGLRCLMPARGWYEWNRKEPVLDSTGRETGQPYFIFSPSAPVLSFAGLWSPWARSGAAPQPTCAVLTRTAAPDIAFIHPRMPVVLKPANAERWLDPATPLETLVQLIEDAEMELAAHPVSTRVNNIRNDSLDLLHRIHPPPAGLFPLEGI